MNEFYKKQREREQGETANYRKLFDKESLLRESASFMKNANNINNTNMNLSNFNLNLDLNLENNFNYLNDG